MQLIKERIHKDSPASSLHQCVQLVREVLKRVIKKNEEHLLARVKGVSVHGFCFVQLVLPISKALRSIF